MGKSKYVYFTSMRRAITELEDYECWVLTAENGDYYLAYITMDGSGYGYISNHPISIEDIEFPEQKEVHIFLNPVCMKLGESEWY